MKEYTWCFNVPPKCSKYKIKFREVFKTQTLVKYRPVEECCAGYAPDARGEQCVAVCVESCVHGKCVAPNTCACAHGYGGPACDICKLCSYIETFNSVASSPYSATVMNNAVNRMLLMWCCCHIREFTW